MHPYFSKQTGSLAGAQNLCISFYTVFNVQSSLQTYASIQSLVSFSEVQIRLIYSTSFFPVSRTSLSNTWWHWKKKKNNLSEIQVKSLHGPAVIVFSERFQLSNTVLSLYVPKDSIQQLRKRLSKKIQNDKNRVNRKTKINKKTFNKNKSTKKQQRRGDKQPWTAGAVGKRCCEWLLLPSPLSVSLSLSRSPSLTHSLTLYLFHTLPPLLPGSLSCSHAHRLSPPSLRAAPEVLLLFQVLKYAYLPLPLSPIFLETDQDRSH